MGSKNRIVALSSLELYRRGELEEVPYDLSDPLDRAIWSALQCYVDYLELLDVERDPAARKERNVYGKLGTRTVSARAPYLLEVHMNELRSWERGRADMGRGELYETALRVLEALFAPAKSLSGVAIPWGQGEYGVPRLFWEAGEKELEGPENVGDDELTTLTGVAQEAPLRVPERLAPLFGLILRALGPMVSQAEAARRLNLTPRGVALRIERSEMRHIRVGGSVLIPEEDVKVTKEERLQARGRSVRN
jgi:excisionase family DNA binding protein